MKYFYNVEIHDNVIYSVKQISHNLPKKSAFTTLLCYNLQHSVQFSSVAQSCPTLCDPVNHSTPGLPVHHQLPEFTQTHVHRVGDAIQPSHPLLSPFLPAANPSQHQSLFPMSQLFAWVGHSTGVSALASFLPKNTQDWSPLGWTGWTLKSLVQHHSSKASIFRHSAFFTVQLSHPYMTTGKTIALTRGTFVGNMQQWP